MWNVEVGHVIMYPDSIFVSCFVSSMHDIYGSWACELFMLKIALIALPPRCNLSSLVHEVLLSLGWFISHISLYYTRLRSFIETKRTQDWRTYEQCQSCLGIRSV
jgi:hypothetical protein